jgi:hypothetical protein
MNKPFTSHVFTAVAVAATALLTTPMIGFTAEKEGPTRACYVTPTAMDCYPTERDLYAAYPELKDDAPQTEQARTTSLAAAAACSTTLKLYTGTSYGGSVYVFNTRQQVINLPAGIDNAASSYKIGACSASLYENANLGGAAYPGSTSAGAAATSMAAGWDNRISSIWIA